MAFLFFSLYLWTTKQCKLRCIKLDIIFQSQRTQDKSLFTCSSFNCISLQKPVSSCDNIKPRRNGSPTSISSRCVSAL